MQVIFLGCSDEYGVPRVGCDCEVCRNVLSADNRNYRTGSSIALHYGPSHAKRTVLVDVAPEFRLQATGSDLRQVDALLLTHTGDAHTLGLGTLLDGQQRQSLPLQVCAPTPVLDGTRERFHHLWTDRAYRRILQSRAIEEPIDLWGLEVQPMRVDHGARGRSFGYHLRSDELRLAYVPTMLRASSEIREALMDLDLLVLGASHYYDGTETWKRTVMDIAAALELIREVAPQQAILTYLSHTLEYGEISARLSPGTRLAYDGLIVEMEK